MTSLCGYASDYETYLCSFLPSAAYTYLHAREKQVPYYRLLAVVIEKASRYNLHVLFRALLFEVFSLVTFIIATRT